MAYNYFEERDEDNNTSKVIIDLNGVADVSCYDKNLKLFKSHFKYPRIRDPDYTNEKYELVQIIRRCTSIIDHCLHELKKYGN